jgi:hypothetical protein
MAMTTRPTQNQVRAASLELVMMGLLRRDMDPPGRLKHRTLAARPLNPQEPAEPSA